MSHFQKRLFRTLCVAMFFCASQALLGVAGARAAGLFLAPAGVVPLGQGGAVVASIADPLALLYNPAGLASAKRQLYVDVGVPLFISNYRRTIVPDGPELPPVRGLPVALAVPNAGLVWAPKSTRGPALAALISSDYPLVQRLPTTDVWSDAPARYASQGFAGSWLLRAVMGAAWAPTKYLSIGASAQLLTGSLRTRISLSACDGVICRQPEDTSFDADAALSSALLQTLGFGMGVQVRLSHALRLGLSYTSGHRIDAAASMAVQLPTAAFYRGAKLQPLQPSAHLVLRLPGQLRLGAELRLPRGVFVEVNASYTFWHVHQQLALTQLDAVMTNMVAIGGFRLPDVRVPRQFHDVLALHAAVRRTFCFKNRELQLQGGAMLEPSAVPDNMLTAMAIDLPKALLSTQVALQTGRVRWTLTAAYMAMLSRSIRNSVVGQINPTQSDLSPFKTAVGNGHYSGSALLLGVASQVFFP